MEHNIKNSQLKNNRNELIYEILNSLSHGLGVIIGAIFLAMILYKYSGGDIYKTISYVIYIFCFIFMFLSSAMYHAAQSPKLKSILRIFDHSSIFIFIAGTYTPIVWYVLAEKTKYIFLILIWGIAIAGFLFKVFTYGKYDKYLKTSVILYLAMGWISIFLIRSIVLNTNVIFLILLVSGGVLYTIGTYFYSKKNPKYNHIIWHFFVLAAAICHFIAIYYFLTL